MDSSPTFSIVIPAYNRQQTVARALDSCLRQTLSGYEIIVVDDASTDRTAWVVGQIAHDNRAVTLVRHAENQGVGAARNTGVRNANAKWIVFLDSDDELVPEALQTILTRIQTLPPDARRMSFRCLWDDGHVTPEGGWPQPGFWDLTNYLSWFECLGDRSGESMQVLRRDAFDQVRWTGLHELRFHLDTISRYGQFVFDDVLRLYHQDAGNQLSYGSSPELQVGRLERSNLGTATHMAGVLRAYETEFREYAPTSFFRLIHACAIYFLLAGRRWQGAHWALRALAARPLNVKLWLSLGLGLLSPSLFRTLYFRRLRRIAKI